MFSLFKRNPYRAAASQLYDQLVRAARAPVFYADYGVPDTVEGRFEVLTLHVYAVLNRLRGDNENPQDAEQMAQALFDAMFKNMDYSFREAGVGDLSVPKKMKFMMTAFNGRCHAYYGAGTDKARLRDVIRRNVFGTVAGPQAQHIDAVADYFCDVVRHIGTVPATVLLQGHLPPFKGAFAHEKAA